MASRAFCSDDINLRVSKPCTRFIFPASLAAAPALVTGEGLGGPTQSLGSWQRFTEQLVTHRLLFSCPAWGTCVLAFAEMTPSPGINCISISASDRSCGGSGGAFLGESQLQGPWSAGCPQQGALSGGSPRMPGTGPVTAQILRIPAQLQRPVGDTSSRWSRGAQVPGILPRHRTLTAGRDACWHLFRSRSCDLEELPGGSVTQMTGGCCWLRLSGSAPDKDLSALARPGRQRVTS